MHLSNSSSDVQSCIDELCWIISPGRVHVGAVGGTMNKDGYQCFRQAGCDSKSVPRVNGSIREDNVSDRCAYIPPSIIRICPLHSSCDSGGVELVAKDVHALLHREREREERAKGLGGAVRGLVECKLRAGLEHPLSAWKRKVQRSEGMRSAQ